MMKAARIALLKVQESDVKIAELDREMEGLPHKAKIVAIRSKQREGEPILAHMFQTVRELDAQITALQDQVDAANAKINAEQKKLETSSAHRDVMAITADLESLTKRIGELEETEMSLLEKREDTSRKIVSMQEKMSQLGVLEEQALAAYKAAYRELAGTKHKFSAVRAQIAATIPESLLERYEGIRAKKGGVGLGQFDGSRCLACNIPAPVSFIDEIEDSEDIPLCPSCKRMLIFVRNDPDEGES